MIIATFEFQSGSLDTALEFLKRARWELRPLRKVHAYSDRIQIIDVNGDCLEITGVGHTDREIVPLLMAVNAAFDPNTIHDSTDLAFKEFTAGRRHPWAEDRVM